MVDDAYGWLLQQAQEQSWVHLGRTQWCGHGTILMFQIQAICNQVEYEALFWYFGTPKKEKLERKKKKVKGAKRHLMVT